MRLVIAAILICAIGVPAALALPATSAKQLSALSGRSVQQIAKKSRPAPQRQSRGSGAGGIHPLVGSGEY